MVSTQLKLFAQMLHVYGLHSMRVIGCSYGINLAKAFSTAVADVGLVLHMFYHVICKLFEPI